MNEPINLDPIEPTAITPNLTAIPLTPTVWDDLPDGQHAVTPNGIVFQRRKGLWHMDPWWQNNGDGAEIAAICADPDSWAYNDGWPRHIVEDAHGPLDPVKLPGDGYPHDDERCRQDSVDAAGFREACRAFGRIAEAAGLSDTSMGFAEVAEAVARRLRETR